MWIPEGPERTTNGLREWASSSRNVNTHMIGKEVSIRGEMEGKTGLDLWTGVGEVGRGGDEVREGPRDSHSYLQGPASCLCCENCLIHKHPAIKSLRPEQQSTKHIFVFFFLKEKWRPLS